MNRPPRWYCGIDWSNHLHDVAVVDRNGVLVTALRISDAPADVEKLLDVLRGLSRSHNHSRRQVPVAIETNRGLLVDALRAKRQPVYQIPPSTVAVRRRHRSPAPTKSDRSDAHLLALIVRDGWDHLGPLPHNSPRAAAVSTLSLAQLRAQRAREQWQAKLLALLRQAHPAAVTAWAHLDHGIRRYEARAVLAAAPTAATARTLTRYQLARILTAAGRIRLVDAESCRLRDLFAQPVLRLPSIQEQALTVEVGTMLDLFDHACGLTDRLTAQLTDLFAAHADAPIYRSMPGCGPLLAARLLGELGDDPDRFGSARGLRAYAGVAPLTWASGVSRAVTHRRICNRRLKTIAHQWAFCSLTRSPGCRALYDARRARGDSYAGALRHVAGRLLTCLRHCLNTAEHYDEHIAFPNAHRTPRMG
jgi:transposase